MRALRKRRQRGVQLFTVEKLLIERMLDAERTEHLRCASSPIRSSGFCGLRLVAGGFDTERLPHIALVDFHLRGEDSSGVTMVEKPISEAQILQHLKPILKAPR